MNRPQSVDSILGEWLVCREQGEASSAADLLRLHPEHAEELRLRLHALNVIDGLLAGDPSPPPRIGRYTIRRELGRGGMGVVYEARAPDLDAPVALKVLYPGQSDTPELLRRIQRQVATSRSLAHPAIVCHWGVENADGKWFCTSDLVQGRSLDRLVTELKGMGAPTSGADRARRAAELFAPLADALQFAHDQGVIHRDVKPSNLILGDDGRLRLTDLDLAHIGGGSGAITRPGAVLGTPCYMSPEQALGAPVDARTDVYSLGATLYEWVTLERPFRGETVAELAREIVSRPPRPPCTVDRSVPKPLQTIILKAMEKEPRRRYESAAALAEDLRRLAEGRPIVARPPSVARRAAAAVRRAPVASTAAAALVAIGLALALLAPRSDAATWIDAAERSREEGDLRRAIEQADEALRIEPGHPEARRLRERLERRRAKALADAAALDKEIEAMREEERKEQGALVKATAAHKRLYSLCFEGWAVEADHVKCKAEERARDTAEARLAGLRMQIGALQRRRDHLKALQPGLADAVEAELREHFLDLWKEARATRRREHEAVFLAFACAPPVAPPATTGRLRIAPTPPDAELRLFRYEPEETGLREVPVPANGGARAGECLVVTRVDPHSPAASAGLAAGDLVLRLNGEPCGRGLFVASVRPGGVADGAGVRPLDRIEENHGWPVDTLHEWNHRLETKAYEDFVPVKVGGRDLKIPWGARPEDALGIVPAKAEALLAEAAPGRGMRLSCLRSGTPVDVLVPEGAKAGVSCEPTAYPFVLSKESLVPAGSEIEVEGGSYVVHVRRKGFEDGRWLFKVEDGALVHILPELLPEGSTPEGFVHVHGATFTMGGDPAIEGCPPPRSVTVPGFFIARFELTTGEYFEFLNDPETLRLIHRELARGNRILFPRDDGSNELTEFLPDGTLRHIGASDRTPIRGISYEDAMAYIAWRNARGGKFRYALPSEEQWELSARGPDGRYFPWGDRFDYSCCVGMHSRHEDCALAFEEAGSEPRDESPYGVRDMAGSRQEWTSTSVLRGGNYLACNPPLYGAAYRAPEKAPHRYFGIRLVAIPVK